MPLCRGKAFWSFTKNPDVKYEPVWRITVQMEDSEAQKLKEFGVKVRRNDDGIFEYKFKRNVTNRKTGGQNPPPRVVDAQKEPFDQIIGNGSKVVVQYKPFEWKNSFGKGVGLDLQAVQVIEHIPYAGGDGSADELEVVDDTADELTPAPKSKKQQVDDEY